MDLKLFDSDEDEPEYSELLNWDFLDATGLSTTRDDYDLDGTDMKVGILEADTLPNPSLLPNSNITNLYGSIYGSSPANTHGTKVASLMVANYGDFVGAIPNAELYASVLQAGTAGIDSDMALLLDCDVTAINLSCSPSHFENPYDLNGYDDFAKYLDYISVSYDVSIVMSSGNFEDEGIGSSNMAYNALIVGSCSNQGKRSDYSSYNSSPSYTYTRYKPDLLAPGENLATVVSTDPFTGTSASAPLVTSAVIQLTQAKPALIGKTQLIKSIILSSANITTYMDPAEVISPPTYYANKMYCSKKYGSGILDMVKAYETACVDETYHYESMPVGRPAVAYSEYIDAQNQRIRFSMCWDKINTETYSYAPDSLSLKITAPNGNIYESNFLFDNKQIITIDNAPSGTYSIDIFRNNYENSYQPFKLGFSYSIS